MTTETLLLGLLLVLLVVRIVEARALSKLERDLKSLLERVK